MPTSPRLALALCLAAIPLLASCGGDDSPTATTPEPAVAVVPDDTDADTMPEEAPDAAEQEEAGPIDAYTAAGLATALEDLAAQVGADPMRLTKLAVYPDYVIVEAIDPAAAEELNEWRHLNGEVGDHTPIDISGSDEGALEANLFGSDEVDPAVIEGFIQAALARAAIDDGEMSHLVIQRGLTSAEVEITSFISGERANKTIRGNLAGEITREDWASAGLRPPQGSGRDPTGPPNPTTPGPAVS